MNRSPLLHEQPMSTALPSGRAMDPCTPAIGKTSIVDCIVDCPSSVDGSPTIAEAGGAASTAGGGDSTPQAVAPVDRKVCLLTPAGRLSGHATDSADGAGGIGYHEGKPHGRPMEGIAPYRGWTLWCQRLGRHHYDLAYLYCAEKGGRFNYLHLTGTFEMTQARWEWLVDNGFPSFVPTAGPFAGAQGPWSEELLDAAMAGEG